ncbi:MAG TPA: MerR family transcriptional regulator [Gallionella sp.]|nr:MerR family transcriptional regulator [Gallionella sp.]
MLLRVGELAKRCGLTVRTLHHYDSIGLLTPSVRSDSGYRLYNRDDIARLHQVQALRRLGLPLADIGAVLANPGLRLASIVEQQIELLEKQIDQGKKLHDRLSQLRGQLMRGEKPELADWLTTLEMMTMYDKYFSANELKRFPLLDTGEKVIAAEWAELVKSVREAMNSRIPPESPEAQALSKRWMNMLVRDTNGDPRLLVKLNEMQYNEPSAQVRSGITPEVMAYIQRAFAETKLVIYQKYLSPDEFQFMRENYTRRGSEWPALTGAIRQHLEDGTTPDDPRMQKLAMQWMELFRSYAGDNPQTQAKIRAAHEAEPELLAGTFIDKPLLGYVIRTMASLTPT